MDLDRVRAERPNIFLTSDERELVSAFDEPPEEVRQAFLDALPKLLIIYQKKRRALANKDERLWNEVIVDEAALVGSGP
jgi:hypothetical protein